MKTPAGMIPKILSEWNLSDYAGMLLVRFGISRNNYSVDPGLYALGSPDEYSEIFVTANYKLSFDIVRKNLSGINAWMLVLDTKGINVWCAAGKGTFGTDELIHRINLTSLHKIVNHKRLILPQLGAVGVAAHAIKKMTGFTVIYGPVRATDLQDFIKSHHKVTKEMRRVTFEFKDRIKLIPVDVVSSVKYLLYLLIPLYLFFLINDGFSFYPGLVKSLPAFRNIILGYISGLVVTPILLPYLPGRSFAFKGFVAGLLVAFILFFNQMLGGHIISIISWFISIPGISSFLAMNFTGSSTYTSLSGVKKEMKIAVPLQIASIGIPVVLILVKTFI
jgi:acetyl-CoA decarbonylase/synthase complex subunit gamma